MSAPRQSFLFSSCDSKSTTAPGKDSRPSAIKSSLAENSNGLNLLFSGLERSLNGCVMASSGDKQDAAKELINAVAIAKEHAHNIQSCVETKAEIQSDSSAPQVKF